MLVKLRSLKIGIVVVLSLVFNGAIVRGMAQPSSVSRPSNVSNPQLITKLNQTIPQLLDSDSIPGLAISVIKDGKIVYTQVYGVKNAETKEKMAINTVFEAGFCLCLSAIGGSRIIKPG